VGPVGPATLGQGWHTGARQSQQESIGPFTNNLLPVLPVIGVTVCSLPPGPESSKQKIQEIKMSVVTGHGGHSCIPSTQEAEAGGL
jgi:hypothetical protein